MKYDVFLMGFNISTKLGAYINLLYRVITQSHVAFYRILPVLVCGYHPRQQR